MNNEPELNMRYRVWQMGYFRSSRTATILKTGFGLICFALFVSGCGNARGPATSAVRSGTNQVGLVSVGVLNTVDGRRQEAIMRYFATNGVASFVEGSVMFDVMVHHSDVERARSILKENPPPDGDFRLAY